MTKVYIRNNEIQDANGTTISADRRIVEAVKKGCLNTRVVDAILMHRIRFARGEEIACEIIYPDGIRDLI